jgi:mono/diheme cytochrome c family protein
MMRLNQNRIVVRRALIVGLCVGVLAVLGVVADLTAQTTGAEAAARGKVTYRIYCRNCHGAEATGDGPLAELLTVAPSDLTRITARHDGEFPEEWMKRVIDGREVVRGHGMREMPVWGLSFRDPSNPGNQEEEVGARIDQLIAYLKSIQVSE